MYLYSSLQPPSLSVSLCLSLSLALPPSSGELFSHTSNSSGLPLPLITHPKCYSPLPSSLVPLCSLSLPNTFLPSNPASHHSYAFFALLLPSIPLSVSGSSLRTFPDVTVQYCPRGQQHKTCSVAHKHTHTRSALTQ